ncbi:MAG TPA: RNA methyltransferase [Pyrinomonadaceae bacterium]|jgi:TrmH family RNA methyltransferase|nr:RNA methyltransferase [Pyrinomonadaceae bacterium]
MITSRDNSLLRLARSVRDGKTPEFIFVEGLRLCEEALRSGLSIEAVIVSDQLAAKERAATLVKKLTTDSKRTGFVSEKLLESISYTKTPQGIIVLAGHPETSEQHFAENQKDAPLIVIMHRINNPVNVGAILRTAEAAGATGAIATQNTTDPFSAKSLRGAMGSTFRLPVWFGPTYTEAVDWCSQRGIQTICADVHASTGYEEVNWRQPSALILGAESSGLTPEDINAATAAVRIPMRGPAESLNVAVATGVLLYEAARQRQS